MNSNNNDSHLTRKTPGMGGIEPIRESLEALLKKRGMYSRARSMIVFGLWPRVVGPDISRNTRPLRVNDGVLIVAVRNHVWANEMVFLKRQILKAINSLIGDQVVIDVKFYVKWDWDETVSQNGKPTTAPPTGVKHPADRHEEKNLNPADYEEMKSICNEFKDQLVRDLVYKTLTFGITVSRNRRLEDT